MAVPKGKVSKQRRNKRRSSVWKLAAPALVACPKCGALHLPHRMWPRGQGRQVCGREISSVVPLQEGSAASLLFFTAPTLFVMGSIKIHRFTLCSWAAILYCACVSRQKTV